MRYDFTFLHSRAGHLLFMILLFHTLILIIHQARFFILPHLRPDHLSGIILLFLHPRTNCLLGMIYLFCTLNLIVYQVWFYHGLWEAWLSENVLKQKTRDKDIIIILNVGLLWDQNSIFIFFLKLIFLTKIFS